MSNPFSATNTYGPLVLAEDFSTEMLNAFEVMHSVAGVEYKPLAFQAQVVAGLNYSFFCRATGIYPKSPSYLAKVIIFASLPDEEGKVHYSISEIERIEP